MASLTSFFPANKSNLSKASLERKGRLFSGICIVLVGLLVVTLIYMVASRGVSTFTRDGISFVSFISGSVWDPHQISSDGSPYMGALPMLVGSFATTLLSCAIALPFALASSIFVVEIAPGFGTKLFQPLLEVLTGIPSVVFGMVGLSVVVPWVRTWAGGTGFGILPGALVIAIMILPTITSLTCDALRAVPTSYRDGSYGLGATRAQTIAHVVLPSALPSIATAVVLGMTRAFGEALAVQMVVGNAAQMPTSLTTPAATLTSVLTMGMGNEAMGTVYNDVLWSLALVLLAVSLTFILIIHLISRKGVTK